MNPEHTIIVYPVTHGHDIFNFKATHFSTDENGHLWIYNQTRLAAFFPCGEYICVIPKYEED